MLSKLRYLLYIPGYEAGSYGLDLCEIDAC